MTSVQAELESLLRQDLASRRGEKPYELCDLSSLSETKRWDYSLPTLYDHHRHGRQKFGVRNQATFNAAFFQQFPELKGVDLGGMGFLAAGGSISQMLQANGGAEGDVDLFLHQESPSVKDRTSAQRGKPMGREATTSFDPPQTPEDATRRVLELARILVANHLAAKKAAAYRNMVEEAHRSLESSAGGNGQARKPSSNSRTETEPLPPGVPASVEEWEPDSDLVRKWYESVECVRAERCATLYLDGRRYQFVFRLYRSPAEVLYGFDVHSSAAGFDGFAVRMTPLCKFSHEFGVNVVDLTRRSTTLEKRLLKYWTRGFDLVLPELDVSKVPNRLARYKLDDVCELPYMSFAYKKVCGNRIRVTDFQTEHWPRSTADPIAADKLTALDVVRNRGGALGAQEDYSSAELAHDQDIEFRLAKANLYRLARNQESKGLFYRETGKHYERALLGSFYIPAKVIDSSFKTLRKDILGGHDTVRHVCLFLGEDRVSEVMEALYVKKLPVLGCLDALLGGLEKSVREKVVALQSRQRPIEWNVQDPTTQLVGSFNPIPAHPSEWYGPYYRRTE